MDANTYLCISKSSGQGGFIAVCPKVGSTCQPALAIIRRHEPTTVRERQEVVERLIGRNHNFGKLLMSVDFQIWGSQAHLSLGKIAGKEWRKFLKGLIGHGAMLIDIIRCQMLLSNIYLECILIITPTGQVCRRKEVKAQSKEVSC